MANTSIGICIAAFNRREKTLACLRRLESAERPAATSLKIYVLDDASTDGTGAAIRSEFPDVTVLDSTGDLWWAGGMRKAFGAALADGHDFYIWMNDDVEIKPDAIVTLLNTYHALHAADGREHVISGAMLDKTLDRTSYGGFRLNSRFHPSSYRMVLPEADKPAPLDLVNGNMLLIPGKLAEKIGNIPTPYIQTLADWDYGLRAQKAGAKLWLAPGHVGFCDVNVPGRRRWGGKDMTLRERYKRMLHPLGLPFKARATFLRAHFPYTAPILMFSPYAKLPVDHILWRLGLKK